MAQPHQYVGTGVTPPVAGESYEESWQPDPFTVTTGLVPGKQKEVDVSVTSRSITDAATETTVTSTTHNPMPHVEYGRIGDN